MKNHIVIGKNKATGLYRGLFYVNHPSPSGFDRPVLAYSTKDEYKTNKSALEAIAQGLASILPVDVFNEIEIPELNARTGT